MMLSEHREWQFVVRGSEGMELRNDIVLRRPMVFLFSEQPFFKILLRNLTAVCPRNSSHRVHAGEGGICEEGREASAPSSVGSSVSQKILADYWNGDAEWDDRTRGPMQAANVLTKRAAEVRGLVKDSALPEKAGWQSWCKGFLRSPKRQGGNRDARRRDGISDGLGLGFAIMRLFSMRQERLSLRHDPI